MADRASRSGPAAKNPSPVTGKRAQVNKGVPTSRCRAKGLGCRLPLLVDNLTGRASEGEFAELFAATSSAAGGGDLDDLLTNLASRARALMRADTSAVLLLDESGKTLVARAAAGLEEEVRQGVRVPVGRGFAGRVAADKAPVILDSVEMGRVVNPILPAKGIRAMLGVPLISNGDLLGVLHVGSFTKGRFTSDDARLLERAATNIASAIQIRMLTVEKAAAELLERSLMPSELPECPGLDLAARYVPAESAVGGDWYDVFVLPEGELWVVTGDVAGHGLRGAVIMGRVRSTLRAYALLGGTPSEVLTLTDRKLEHFEPGALVTIVCASTRPPYDSFVISSAGHPAPVLMGASGATLVDVDPGPPLGVSSGVARTSATIAVGPGETLLFYTDGLVERRGESLDSGFARLLRAAKVNEAELVCARVMQELVGDIEPADDIAVVAVRRTAGDDADLEPCTDMEGDFAGQILAV